MVKTILSLKDCFKIYFIIFLFSAGITNSCFGQTKSELEKKKKENIEKIEYTRQLLDQTKQERKTSLNQLNLIQSAIDYRYSLISDLEEEKEQLGRQITTINGEIKTNSEQIEKLKKEYAEIVRKSYRNLDKQVPLMYILSAEDINQGYQRLKYLKYLNNYRKTTVEKITALNDSLNRTKLLLADKQEQKTKAIGLIREEREKLANDKNEKNRVVGLLRKKEKELVAEINKREAVQKKIENEIKKILEEEARRARATNSVNRMTPEEKLTSEEFGNNKGHLPWPTAQGIIIGQYGEQNHPVLKGIKIKSNGIDIGTTRGSDVRAVFRGTVTKVIAILGTNYTVIIKHGNFWTVYQNIVDVNVKAGDQVQVKQPIGKVYTDGDNVTKLHFEIWQDRNVLNPNVWLSH